MGKIEIPDDFAPRHPQSRQMWHDDTIMTFGKYKGVRLGDIPDDYLLFALRTWKPNEYNTEFLEYCKIAEEG